MKTQSIATIVAASLVTAIPDAASADLKDAIAGGVVGAIITEGIRRGNQKSQQQQKNVASTPRKATTPSLNGQYNRDERIRIQASLRDMGYNIGVVDGVLGKRSRAAIRNFQASRGEPQTGQLTSSQYAALTNSGFQAAPVLANRPLSRDEVRMLQQGLQMLGYYQGYIDGSNGPGTRAASAAFLGAMGSNSATMTEVQTLVLARTNAGLPTPPYLQQEAANQMAANGNSQFGVPTQQQALFEAQPQQNQFGVQQQPQQNLFGGPAAQQPAGTLAATPGTDLFGAPAPQQQPTQGGQQNLFAPSADQQQAPQVAPQQTQPQEKQPTSVFASTGGTAVQQAPVTQTQQPQSTLDIFAGTQPQQQSVQAQQQPLLQQQATAQQAPSVVPQTGTGQQQTLFAAPSGTEPVATANGGAQPQAGGLDIFAGGSSN